MQSIFTINSLDKQLSVVYDPTALGPVIVEDDHPDMYVMDVNDVEELIKKIFVDYTENLKLIRKELDFANTGHDKDHQSSDE